MIRKEAIKSVEEQIAYQQKKVSDYSVDELRKFILSEEKKILGQSTGLNSLFLLVIFAQLTTNKKIKNNKNFFTIIVLQ